MRQVKGKDISGHTPFMKGSLMRLFVRLIAPIALCAALLPAAGAATDKNNPQVIGWVPPYGLEASAFAIHSNRKIGKNLTRLGLQLWNPTADGKGVTFAPMDANGTLVAPESVIRFRDWARARNIKVLLTVYNNSQVLGKWDWDLARRGFKDNRSAFVNALIAEMDKYELDGIDLDLEGEGDHDGDRVAYAAFVKELSDAIRPRGKLLTIDTFHSPCANAPNMSWWKDWVGQIDTLHSMGYQDLYEASEDTFTPAGKPVCENGSHIFKYSWQLAYGMKAGYRVDQIVLGQPTWLGKWGKAGKETDTVSHIKAAQALGAGIALWDLQLGAPEWRTDATWDAVKALRTKPGTGWKLLK
ncbi:MAG: hypothetical protein K0S28_964 [Paucimonas sp.]|nr:hypothetical protein [Paucimonas sp.]